MFATVEDVRRRWVNASGGVTDEVIQAVLEDAEVWLRASYPVIPARPVGQLSRVLALVSVSMVKRSLLAADRDGVSQQQATAGPFSQSMSYRNPDGDLFLTAQERQMLETALDDAGADSAVSMEAVGW